MKIIKIDKNSVIPIYKQIIKSVEKSISGSVLSRNSRLPSINKVCIENNISRDTVLLAYEELKKRGIIYSIIGKGYFVKTEHFAFDQRFFLLFDELNAFKEDLYNSFINALDHRIHVDIYFHHFNKDLFKKLILDSKGSYSKYIIMPSNLEGIETIIHELPVDDVYILDQTRKELSNYPAIYQNFISSMFSALEKGLERLRKYQQLVLIFSDKKEPIGMIKGFNSFCQTYQFSHQIITNINDLDIKKEQVYIIPNDRHLVEVIEYSKNKGYKIGEDIGIISYNDTPLKKVVANGITTISTDFVLMGKILADMAVNNKKLQIENVSHLIARKSL